MVCIFSIIFFKCIDRKARCRPIYRYNLSLDLGDKSDEKNKLDPGVYGSFGTVGTLLESRFSIAREDVGHCFDSIAMLQLVDQVEVESISEVILDGMNDDDLLHYEPDNQAETFYDSLMNSSDQFK
jgi:hypothetical protein